MDEKEIINSLLEPMEIDEIVLSGLVATPCADGHRVQIVGWSEMPDTLKPNADTVPERLLALRAIMPIEAYREFIRREMERLKES